MAQEAEQNTPTPGSDPTADRRIKLQKLRTELKVDPFGQRTDGLMALADARAAYDEPADAEHKADATKDRRPVVHVAGRIVLHRDIGKLVFMTIRDSSGDLQIGVSKKAVDELSFNMAKLADLGDIVVASGRLGTTKTGEVTVWAEEKVRSQKEEGRSAEQEQATSDKEQVAGTAQGNPGFRIATKSLIPPPEKWHGLQDSELRYRQRYVDLWANPQVMRTMQLRMRIVEEIRQYFRGRGFMEVETPMLQPIHGGAAARPFVTHHNALDMRLYLRIAPELYLKRLLVGGFPKVFEVNRNFRNEGISPRHNPEFTMLEAYEAFGSWETMGDLVEDMICTVAQKVLGTLKIEHKDAEGKVTKTINLTRPWRRVRMVDLVEERTGWKFDKRSLRDSTSGNPGRFLARAFWAKHQSMPAPTLATYDDPAANRALISACDQQAAALLPHLEQISPAEQLVEVYEKLIEPTLIDPTYVTHVPSVAIPLARENREDPYFADVYELAINGQEISPGYSELNDPDVQERHLRHQVGDREEQQQVDEDFLNALRVGMPPAGGMGLGIDRLVMMLTGAESIRDVILFPLLRPET